MSQNQQNKTHSLSRTLHFYFCNNNCITLQIKQTLMKQKEIKSVLYNIVYYSLSTYLNIDHIVTITFQAVGHKPFTNFDCTLTQYFLDPNFQEFLKIIKCSANISLHAI